MQTIEFKMSVSFSEESTNALAKILAPAIREALGLSPEEIDERQEARLRASRNAIYGGRKPPEDQGLLIDSRQAAKLLKVSERTLFKMHTTGEMPPPIRIGVAKRWSLEALKKWVEAGCPKSP
jgi:predicted DNA-binding transcriptional regulator AlpA